jgi:hypothetical protein
MSGGLTAALVEFQAMLPKVGKTSTAKVGAFSYDYADLSDVSETVLPALAAVGIAYTTTLRSHGSGYVLIARLRHISGESIQSEWPVQAGGAQQMGSAITYGRRYCLLAMCGVHPAGEDDDGAAGVMTVEQRPRRRPPVARPSDTDDPDRITDAQVKKLWTQMRNADMGNDDVARQWMASVLGVKVDEVHTRELSKEQAKRLFDELKLLVGRADRSRPTEPPADQWTTVDPTTGEITLQVGGQ